MSKGRRSCENITYGSPYMLAYFIYFDCDQRHHLQPRPKLAWSGLAFAEQDRPLPGPGARQRLLLCVAEMGKGRRAAFDLLGEPGPTVRRPPDPSPCTRHACRFSPTMHARTICPSSHLRASFSRQVIPNRRYSSISFGRPGPVTTNFSSLASPPS